MQIGDQMKCQLECSKSCLQTCNDTNMSGFRFCDNQYATAKDACETLPLAKQAKCKLDATSQNTNCTYDVSTQLLLCKSDCFCSMIAGPNGAGRKNVEDMYRLKFCKVPTEKVSLSP